jgi:hypothetical protein
MAAFQFFQLGQAVTSQDSTNHIHLSRGHIPLICRDKIGVFLVHVESDVSDVDDSASKECVKGTAIELIFS